MLVKTTDGCTRTTCAHKNKASQSLDQITLKYSLYIKHVHKHTSNINYEIEQQNISKHRRYLLNDTYIMDIYDIVRLLRRILCKLVKAWQGYSLTHDLLFFSLYMSSFYTLINDLATNAQFTRRTN